MIAFTRYHYQSGSKTKFKCYSQILCGGSAEILDFAYFVLIWWQTDKIREILKQSCKDLVIWTELPIV